MIETAYNIFFCILLLLFALGSLSVVFEFARSRTSRNLLKVMLVAILALPMFIYVAVGSFDIPFGHPRNFFYLLPIYFFIIFYLLERLFGNRKIFYAIALLITAFLLSSGIASSYGFWKQVYAEREMIGLSGQLDADSVAVFYSQRTGFPFMYYAKRFGVLDKAYAWYDNNDSLLGVGDDVEILAIVHNSDEDILPAQPIKQHFTIDSILYQSGYYGPFGSFQELIDKPSALTIAFFKKEMQIEKQGQRIEYYE